MKNVWEWIVNRIIQLDVNSIQNILPSYHSIDRKGQIQELKQAIYQYRNQLLSDIFSVEISNHSFEKTDFGKPYLIDYPKFHVNHSHSQQHYALASSQQIQDLGVDVEDLNRKVRFEALAKHAFHPQEYQAWQALDFDPTFWFKVWTTKEAILKASGLGIRLSLNELNTGVHVVNDGGISTHPLLGSFAYQNLQLSRVMLTVAWRSELSCKGFAFPQIQIIQHG
ncbi:4'-phosphopantetheinyl transferase superfamily protein [Acinetobacter sp. RIT698]|uniref:4'-phosphopantetheinyl transferase family protein n=1 Tax=Acinetobacter TaxID=469 RepID=UPI0012AC738D|nr:4'-phosphopantetheinyl transferase superfamily protein [Acinetobacter sp. RIT698]MRT37574.1 4'-phosphopantetheinyl transferase superfamily protein [Acinetobacter sp. RIT698]